MTTPTTGRLIVVAHDLDGFFIEDTIGNYQELRAAGTEAFLIRRPWNESADVPDEHYVDTMDEFAQTVIDEVRSGRFDETPVLGGLAGRRTPGSQGRVLHGVPAGGQFAAAARVEAGVSL